MPQPLQLTVQPRLQAETWSLYWKESNKTETDCLKPVTLSFDADGTTVSNLMDQVAAHVGWPPENGLTALPGFQGPWQRALSKGRALQPTDTLQQAGLVDGATVTVVRIELIAEGWKVEDDLDVSSESDDE